MASFDIDGYIDAPEQADRKTSKFNAAQLKLIRLDALWNDCHRHSRLGELIKWNSDLDRIWCELATFVNKDTLRKKRLVELNGEIGSSTNKFFLLMEKEILLRTIEDEAGLGAAYVNPDDEIM